jgi:hypothetical protein
MPQLKIKILLGLVAVLFISVLFLLYLNITKKPEIVYIPPTGDISLPTTVPTVSSPTLGQKTYKNNDFGIAFSYPSSLKLLSPTNSPHGYKLSFEVDKNSQINIFVRQKDTIVPSDYNSLTPTKINEAQAYQGEVGGSAYFYYTYILGDKYSVESYYVGDENQVNINLFKQIISTFKFTNNPTKSLISADSQTPATGTCIEVSSDQTVSVAIGLDNVPNPRCTKVTSNQKLNIINNSSNPIDITQASPKTSIQPGKSFEFPQTLGSFLAPGVHLIGGAEIWLQ